MQRIFTVLAFLVLIVLIGSGLYMVVEGVSFVDGFYFTLTTLSTVGYGDLVPRSDVGHWIAMGLMVFGVGSGLLLTTLFTSFLVEGRLRALMGGRRMKRAIERMREHYVVCGFGKLGRSVARQLAAAGADFVVVEVSPQKATEARELGHAVVEGDATLPETLALAGLERAAGVAATMSDDAENLYIGLTVRAERPGLPVVCRSSSERARTFFLRAGIQKTISADEMGARRLVNSLIRPHIAEFMDEITQHVEGRPSLHAIRLEAGAPLVGQTILQARFRDEYRIVVLAINREDGFVPNPGPAETLRAGDILILIGNPEQVARLRALLQGMP